MVQKKYVQKSADVIHTGMVLMHEFSCTFDFIKEYLLKFRNQMQISNYGSKLNNPNHWFDVYYLQAFGCVLNVSLKAESTEIDKTITMKNARGWVSIVSYLRNYIDTNYYIKVENKSWSSLGFAC